MIRILFISTYRKEKGHLYPVPLFQHWWTCKVNNWLKAFTTPQSFLWWFIIRDCINFDNLWGSKLLGESKRVFYQLLVALNLEYWPDWPIWLQEDYTDVDDPILPSYLWQDCFLAWLTHCAIPCWRQNI